MDENAIQMVLKIHLYVTHCKHCIRCMQFVCLFLSLRFDIDCDSDEPVIVYAFVIDLSILQIVHTLQLISFFFKIEI